MRHEKKPAHRLEKKAAPRAPKRAPGAAPAASRKSDLLEEAITQMNAGKYGRSSGVLKELLTLDPSNQEARRLFATLQLRIGSLVTARTAFEAMVQEAMERQDYWLAESLLREYLAAGPRCVPFLELLGNVLEIKGDPDAAVREYAKAVEILIEDPDPDHPCRAQNLHQKVLDLDPHSPTAFRLDSLFKWAKEAPVTRITSESADDSVSVRETDSLTSSQESHGVEIPPADPVPSGNLSGGPPRLPWEDDGHDVEVQSLEEATTVWIARGEDTAAPASSEPSGAALPSPTEIPATAPHETDTWTSDEEPPSVRPSGVKDSGEADGADASPAPIATEPTVLDPSPDPPVEHTSFVPPGIESTGAQPAAEPSPRSIFEQFLARFGPDEPSPLTLPSSPSGDSDGTPVATSDATSLTNLEESPSPTLDLASTAPSDSIDRRAIAVPMPWEQVEDAPIVVPPVAEEEPAPRQDAEPPVSPVSAESSEAAIEPPMLGEKVDEGASVGAPIDEALAASVIGSEPPASLPAVEGTEAGVVESPMAWEQADEPPIVASPAVESVPASAVDADPASPSESQSPEYPVQDVNDHLIASILDQADLKSSSPPTTEVQPDIPERAAPSASISVSEAISVPEPAPIRALLDSAIVRGPAPSSWRLEGEPKLEAESVAVEPGSTEPMAQAAPESEPGAASVSRLEDVTQSVQDETSCTDLHEAVETDKETDEAAPAAAEREKGGFSFFPSVLRLVGVTSAQPSESEGDRIANEICESQSLTDPVSEEVHPSTTVEETSPIESSDRSEPPVAEEQNPSAVVEAPAPSTPEARETPPEMTVEGPVEPPSLSDAATTSRMPSVVEARPDTDVVSVSLGGPAESGGESSFRLDPPDEQPVAPAPGHSAGVGEIQTTALPRAEAPVKKRKEKKKKGKHIAPPTSSPGVAPVAAFPADLESPVLPVVEVRIAEAPLSVTATVETNPEPAPPATVPARPEPTQPSVGVSPQSVKLVETMPGSADVLHPRAVPKPTPSVDVGTVVRRIRWRFATLVQTCFTTAHALTVAIISVVVLTVGVVVLGVGGLGVLWLGLEEKPNKAFQDLSSAVPQTSGDVKRSGYALFLGIGAPVQKDAVQVGAELHANSGKPTDLQPCFGSSRSGSMNSEIPSVSSLGNWFREPNPSRIFGDKASTIKGWTSESSTGLDRYRQWTGMPFEDGGYGLFSGPDCAAVLHLHRLQVAEGFAQNLEQGIDRLEADMTHWRGVLRKARTLGVKMLAVAAINDDARVASGLILSPELDGKYLPRLAKATVPLDQVELSMRWPMQSQFMVQKRVIDRTLKNELEGERPWYAAGIAAMPVPRQRLLNDYAEYYEALVKVAETSREKFTAPNLYAHIHAPAQGILDYLANPINNLLAVETGPAWESHVGRIRETDALLRLVSLQVWIRKAAQEGAGDVKTRLARAGQNFYDPFTGLPMLVNASKGRLYSVGMNGRDDDGAPDEDVSVALPPPGLVSQGSGAPPPAKK